MIHNKNGDTQSYIVFSKCYFFGWTMLPKQSLSPSVTFNINPSHFDNNPIGVLISPYTFTPYTSACKFPDRVAVDSLPATR